MPADDRPLLLLHRDVEGDRTPVETRFKVCIESSVRHAVLAGSNPVVIWTFGEKIDSDLLDCAPALRAVVNHGAGLDHVDVHELARRGIELIRPTGANAEAVADHVFGLLLAVRRRIVEADLYVRSGSWTSASRMPLVGEDVAGSTLGIIGFGAIGRAVARRAAGFSMRVLVTTRTNMPLTQRAELGIEQVRLDVLLAHVDALSVNCPLSEETRNLVGQREFGCLRPGAVLINTARGPIVNDAALLEALESGQLAGAGLDVFSDEPNVPPQLLNHPRVVVSPHSADATHGSLARVTAACVDGLMALDIR